MTTCFYNINNCCAKILLKVLSTTDKKSDFLIVELSPDIVKFTVMLANFIHSLVEITIY